MDQEVAQQVVIDRAAGTVTVRCLERLYHRGGASIAISLAINEDLVYLPLSEIVIEFTGQVESEKRVLEVTMPLQLAIDKRLA